MDDDEPGDWAIAMYHAYFSVSMLFVIERDGKPALDWHPSGEQRLAYRWRSYHAARKWMRAHSYDLTGYVIVNLSEILRQAQLRRDHDRTDTELRRQLAEKGA